jgi:hypothetical protein
MSLWLLAVSSAFAFAGFLGSLALAIVRLRYLAGV